MAFIAKERRKWRWQLEEQVDNIQLQTGIAVNIRLFSPAIDFSNEVTKVLLPSTLVNLAPTLWFYRYLTRRQENNTTLRHFW